MWSPTFVYKTIHLKLKCFDVIIFKYHLHKNIFFVDFKIPPKKLSNLNSHIGKSNFNIILTGGLAYLFKNSIKGKVLIKKDLTINGVLKVAKNLK